MFPSQILLVAQRITLVVAFAFLPQNFGKVVGPTNDIINSSLLEAQLVWDSLDPRFRNLLRNWELNWDKFQSEI